MDRGQGPFGARAAALPARPRGWVLLLALLATAFILYASLYPFRLAPLPLGLTAWAALVEAWAAAPVGRGDVLANLLLYLPFGLLLALALPGHSVPARLALGLLAGALLSTMLEWVQLRIAGRVSSPWDVLCNTGGSLLGAAAAALGAGRTLDRPRLQDPLAALLVLGWLAWRFHPWLPTLDLQAWRDNLKPLLLHPVLEPGRLLRLWASWTAAALMAEAALGPRIGRLAAPLGLGLALVAGVVVAGRRPELAEALAIGLALPAWALLRGRAWAAPAMAGALLGVLLAEWLQPFAFTAASRAYGWIPFRSVIDGTRSAALLALLAKVFLLGAVLWWLQRAGLRLAVAACLVLAIVLAASLAQTHLPGRSAEITDALLVLGLAAAFRALPPAPPDDAASAAARSA